MADGAKDSEGPGLAGDLARQASSRARSAASFMENREPSDVVEEVRRFARQRPGTFLAAAAVVGLLAGRLTRGVADEARDQQPSGGQQQGRYAYTDRQYAGQGQYPQGQYAPGAYGAGQYQQAPYGQYPQQSYGDLHHGQYGQAQYGQGQYGHEGVSPRTGQQGQSPREGAPGPYAATSQSPQAAYESAREGAIDPQTGMPIEGTTGRMEDRS